MEKIRNETIDPVELYLAEIAKFEPVTEEEKATLPRLLKQKDPHAMDRMTVAHLTQVVDIAREYKDLNDPHVWYPMLDLIQEGNGGLVKAIREFDWDEPDKFPAYAYSRICDAIEFGILENCTRCRIPRDLTAEAFRAEAEEPRRTAEEPTPTPDPDYRETLRRMLDAPAGGDEIRQYLERNSVTFDDRQWQVMRLRLGLDGNPRLCRKDISIATGLSLLRINMIERKLSEPARRLCHMERRREFLRKHKKI